MVLTIVKFVTINVDLVLILLPLVMYVLTKQEILTTNVPVL